MRWVVEAMAFAAALRTIVPPLLPPFWLLLLGYRGLLDRPLAWLLSMTLSCLSFLQEAVVALLCWLYPAAVPVAAESRSWHEEVICELQIIVDRR